MRILSASDFYPPTVGGLERHVQSLSRELHRRGHGVTVATLRSADQPCARNDAGVAIHPVGSLAGRVLQPFYANTGRPFHPTVPDPVTVRDLRKLIDALDPDIIHARGWIIYSLLAALRRRHRAGVVVTLHDYSLVCPKKTYLRDGHVCDGPQFAKCIRCSSEQYGGTKAALLTSGLHASGKLHERIDHIVAISRAVADASEPETRRRGVPMSVIPSFIPDDAVEAGVESVRPGFLPPDDGFIMYAGALDQHKGLDQLLDAYSRLDTRAPLLLFGPRDDVRHDVPEGVHLLHGIPHAEIMASWARCAVAVVPSVWAEPFGQVAVEAMAMGRPVVASAIGGLTDIVQDGESGLLVPPNSPAALADAIGALLADRELAERIGANAAERARQFLVSNVAPIIEQLYCDVLDRSSSR